ncbi:hypothetical protein JXA27_06860 [Aerococcaceae bacterium zg-B36]|uniref:hypothetical protein n=1 Tax=Aerococcaceae bacterium zg-252 TaxID=2796928 RepID=UPI001BD8C2E7|nr:hypothetical protein [Aerococcaceae bacterium zg-B36]
MPTMSITRDIKISKEDFEKIQAAKPTPLLEAVHKTVESKRSKVQLSKNWIEKHLKSSKK